MATTLIDIELTHSEFDLRSDHEAGSARPDEQWACLSPSPQRRRFRRYMVPAMNSASLNHWKPSLRSTSIVLCLLPLVMPMLPRATTSVTVSTWSEPTILAHSLSLGYGAAVTAISCPAPGDCTAAGTYELAPGGNGAPTRGFVETEVDGHWGGLRSLSRVISSISCPTPGNCGAVGDGFVVSETHDRWSSVRDFAEPTGTTSVNVGNISCPVAGSCVTEGTFFFSTGWSAFVLVESNGHWGQPSGINVAFDAQDTYLFAGSCFSPGNCTLGGELVVPGFGGMDWQAFVLQETSGLWGIARQIGSGSSIGGIACTGPGDCSAAGMAGSAGYVIDEIHGRWTEGELPPGTRASSEDRGGGAGPTACSSPGNCAATGGWDGPDGGWIAWVSAEVGGRWRSARLLGAPDGGNDNLGAVACGANTDCVTIGSLGAAGVVLTETPNGGWSAPRVLPGTAQGAALSDVSCPPRGGCTIGGELNRSGTTYAFVSTQAAT